MLVTKAVHSLNLALCESKFGVGERFYLPKKQAQKNHFKKLQEKQGFHIGVNGGNWVLFLYYHSVCGSVLRVCSCCELFTEAQVKGS